MFILLTITFLLFLAIVNYITSIIVNRDRKKRIYSGALIMLLVSPVAMLGVYHSMNWIELTTLATEIPIVLAGIIVCINGLFIIFANHLYTSYEKTSY